MCRKMGLRNLFAFPTAETIEWCIIILIIVPDKNVHIQFMWNAAAWFNVIFIPFICTLTPITIFQCDLSFVSSPTLPGRGAFAMDAWHVLSRGMALHRIRSLWPAPPHPPQLNWIMLFYMGPSVCPKRDTPILLYLGVEEEERVGGVWSRRKWSFSDRDLSFNGLHEKGRLIFVFPILFQHGMSVTWPPTIDTEQSSSVGFKDDHPATVPWILPVPQR